MTNEEENNNKERRSLVDEDHLVTESLLSWAKDVRYVRRIQSLLADAVEPHFSGIVVSKGTWYTSYLLYVLLIVTRKGRTLGMQATGLQFAESHRVVGSLLAIGISTWALDCWAMTGDRQSQNLSEAEGLRGSNRRRRHELLRQQMLQRASSSQSTVTHSNPSPHSSCNELSYWDRMAMNFRTLIKSLIHSIGVSTQEGPHTLPIHNDGSPTTISPATWILRFHLAQYLITGKFPTVFHRLLGLKHRRDEETSPRVPVPPGTNKIIALLIALKGTASILRYALKWWTKRLALYLEDTESRMKVDHDQHADSQETTAEQQPAILATCAICRMTRMQPAVSKSCGHVFCWPCLNHWVSSVKEACPYCRAPCTLDDIQPLYNYDHATPSEESSNQNKIS